MKKWTFTATAAPESASIFTQLKLRKAAFIHAKTKEIAIKSGLKKFSKKSPNFTWRLLQIRPYQASIDKLWQQSTLI